MNLNFHTHFKPLITSCNYIITGTKLITGTKNKSELPRKKMLLDVFIYKRLSQTKTTWWSKTGKQPFSAFRQKQGTFSLQKKVDLTWLQCVNNTPLLIRNCTVQRCPALAAFIKGVRPPSDSCSWKTKMAMSLVKLSLVQVKPKSYELHMSRKMTQ